MREPGLLLSPQAAANNTIRYFSLARYALLDALRMLKVGAGSRVLLPSFICRDLLAPIAMLGAEPCWYPVGAEMSPESPPEAWPVADVVIAVNFFGFPQDLAPFERYVQRTGATLIEDNAHGYLSQDPQGDWLGTRAKIGLFSVRKTFRFPDGGALMVRNDARKDGLAEQLPFAGTGLHSAQTFKNRIRRLPLFGPALLKASVMLARAARKWRTGSATPLPDPESERLIRENPHPWQGLPGALSRVDAPAEMARRRRLYEVCVAEGRRAGVLSVFPCLPDNCAPYGYPFRSDVAGRQAMQALANRLGLDLVNWPDLPGAIEATSPAHYRDVLLINFLC